MFYCIWFLKITVHSSSIATCIRQQIKGHICILSFKNIHGIHVRLCTKNITMCLYCFHRKNVTLLDTIIFKA